MVITRSKRELLSQHASNPFDDADPLKRACGWGSSELSVLSSASDLGGYGEVGDVTVRVEAADETKGYAEGGGDEDCLTLRDDVDDVSDATWDNPEQCPDEEMNTSDEWDEEEFEEEYSISFKSTTEQQEIRDEMTDLENAVPQLKTDYELLDRLGTGTFSSVYKAIDLNHNEWSNSVWRGSHPAESSAYYQSKPHDTGRKFFVAVKRIYVTSMPDRIKNELAILEDIRGCRHVSQLITAFRNKDQVVAIMPYHRNDDFRDFQHTLPMKGLKEYMRCLFRGLRDIHARGIIHRDIKPANFLFDPRTGIGTICDLGLACRVDYDDDPPCNHTAPSKDFPHGKQKPSEEIPVHQIRMAQQSAKTRSKYPADRVGYPENDTRPQSKANRAGTRGFRAPEVLLKCASQSGAVDIWSAGTILLFFLTGKFPLFHCPNDTEAFVELAVLLGKKAMDKAAALHNRVIITNIPSIEQNGMDLHDFIQTLNPEVFNKHGIAESDISEEAEQARRTYREDIEQAIDLLKATFQSESIKRITPRDALYHPFLMEAPGDDEYFPRPFGDDDACEGLHWQDEVTDDVKSSQDNTLAAKIEAEEDIAIAGSPCDEQEHVKIHETVELETN